MVELSKDAFQLLVELARWRHRTPEEIIRALLLDHENEKYRQVNQQMLAQGLLVAFPTTQLLHLDDFEPEQYPASLSRKSSSKSGGFDTGALVK